MTSSFNDNNLEEILLNKENDKKALNFNKILTPIIIGQIIAVLSVINGVSCNYIQNVYLLKIPITLNFLFYFILFLYNFYKNPTISDFSWVYFGISVLESQGNILNVYAFNKLRFSFPFIINIVSYTWTLFLTFFFISSYKYKKTHFFSSILSLIGVFLCISSIINDQFSFSLEGLFVCLISSLLFSSSSILQEKFIRIETSPIFLKWLGLSSSLLTLLEGVAMKDSIFHVKLSGFDMKLLCLIVVFVISFIVFIEISNKYIIKFSASDFNISLLFTIFWSYLWDIFQTDHYIIKDVLFYLGLVFIFIGIVFFNSIKVSYVGQTEELCDVVDS